MPKNFPGEVPTGADREPLMRRVAGLMRASIRAGYFSFEVEGAERVPTHGPVVYAMNHAGWFALDTFFLTLAVTEARGPSRAPHFAAHDSALGAPLLGPLLSGLGALPASWFRHPERLPAGIESFGICPEGVRGNCKPFWEAYRMREWSRGFVRLALARGATIVPVAVFGGEECLPVAFTVKALEPLVGSILGYPLLPLPLPARWKVVFHEPVQVVAPEDSVLATSSYCAGVAERIQRAVQETLDREAPPRGLARLSSAMAALRARLADPTGAAGRQQAGGSAADRTLALVRRSATRRRGPATVSR